MRTALKIAVVFLLIAVLMLGGFGAGFGVSSLFFHPATAQASDGAPSDFAQEMPVFWEAWTIVQKEFYKQPVDTNKMTYGAITGMVESLGDPHTIFIDADTAKIEDSRLEGSFEGIGATVSMDNGQLTIVAPIKGSPADKAGLKPGDIVLQVNDKLLQGMDETQAISLIRGPKGTTVTLKIQRGTQPPFTVDIVRDTIITSSVESRMLDNNIAYIRLNEFSATAPQDLHKQLQDLLNQKPKGLILDVRSNPGGFLDAAIKVSSEFIKPNSVVLIEKFKNGDKQEYKTEGGGLATDIPMVLLVNEGSASASEILAGALKDYKRATIIGTKTFGKGSVQTPHQLSDDSQLRITIAHFFSPLDHEINEVGVSPDIEVADPTAAQDAQGQDPQLDRAVQYISSGASLDSSPWYSVLAAVLQTALPL